ncbi:WD40-repeat-containing domain protein [Flagelloscypha sp. PMI_526]|nr:WD40-repeat-containing domain protein [Flagelloscypha sp. PMI_526]
MTLNAVFASSPGRLASKPGPTSYLASLSNVATGSLDNTVRIWDTTTCTLIETLHGHTASVYSVAFMKDGNGLVSGSLDKTMRYWDVSQLVSGGLLTSSCNCKDYVLSVGATSSNHWVVSGSKDRTVMLWDTRSGQALCYLQGHKNSG